MKKRIVMMMLCVMLAASGCNAPETVAGIASAAGLTVVARVLNDVEGITDREKALLLANRVVMEEKLAAATTEVEKEKLTAAIEKNKSLTESVAIAHESADVAEAALETDWKDPADSGPFIGAGIASLIAYLINRKRLKLSGILNSIAAAANPTEGTEINAKVNGK